MEKLKEDWDGTSCVEMKWDILKTALCDGAKAELGYENKKHPDWLRESEADLKHPTEERNRLFTVWLSTGQERDKKKHASACRVTRQAVRVAKDTWSNTKLWKQNGGGIVGK